MSLYNSLFGVNLLAPMLLAMLGLKEHDVPRFRDCYFDGENICVYTRTGGGNRDAYESPGRRKANYPDLYPTDEAVNAGPFNRDLRMVPEYVYDDDDDYDSTYATFYFKVPERFAWFKEWAADKTERPAAKRWEDFFAKVEDGDKDDPAVQKLMEVGAPLLEKIKEVSRNDRRDR